VQRHYSGEVENTIITLLQIYSGNSVPNFIRIALVFIEVITKKHVDLFFLDTLYNDQSSAVVIQLGCTNDVFFVFLFAFVDNCNDNQLCTDLTHCASF